MNLLLMILKYCGTAIAGAAGIWGTVSETRDQKTGSLTRWGKCALALAIGGFVVALGAQIVEQILATQDQAAREREKNLQVSGLEKQLALTNEQLALSKRSLALAEKQLQAAQAANTKFQKIHASLVFELPGSDPQVKSLVAVLETLKAQSATPKGSSWPAGISDQGNNAISLAPGYKYIDPKLTALLSPHQNFLRSLKRTGTFVVRIDRAREAGEKQSAANSGPPDLLAAKTNNDEPQSAGVLYYSLKSHRLFYSPPSWQSDKDWMQNGRVVGVVDLDGAALTLSLLGNPPVADMRLVECTLLFDENHPCTLTSFAPVRTKSGVDWAATLPAADKIFSGKAYSYQKFLNEL